MNKPEFFWDEEDRIMHCYITDKRGHTFSGIAACHPDDIDMMSEKTGGEIAFRRARIEQMRYERDAEIAPRLAALKQLYYSMKHSSNFNENSYENRMLQRQIRLTNFDLTTVKEKLAYERQNLKELIAKKDALYKQIRKNREGQN